MTGAQAQTDSAVAKTQPLPLPQETAVARTAARQELSEARSVLPGEPAGPVDAAATCDTRDQRIARILQIQVPLMVVLAQRKMAVGDILNICVGSVIEFDKSFDEKLELLVNNRPIAFGNAVKIGEKFGLRVDQIRDVKARIDALRVGD